MNKAHQRTTARLQTALLAVAIISLGLAMALVARAFWHAASEPVASLPDRTVARLATPTRSTDSPSMPSTVAAKKDKDRGKEQEHEKKGPPSKEKDKDKPKKDNDLPAGWLSDLSTTRVNSRNAGVPILVAFSCPKVSNGFDDWLAAPEDPELQDLLKRFVKVGVHDMIQADIGLFAFDFDSTWATFFIAPDNRIYSRFAAGGPSGGQYLSAASLKQTMNRVLDMHRQRLESEAGRQLTAVERKPVLPHDLFAKKGGGCLRCHQVAEGLHRQAQLEGKFTVESLYVFPPPRNLGFDLDAKTGNTLRQVDKDSAADRAGLKVNDALVAIGATPIVSAGDVFWALQNAPAEGRLTAAVVRDGRREELLIDLTRGWRKYDPSWRASFKKDKQLFKK